MIPTNEMEVVYLFSKIHEKLGFGKITKFYPSGFPDCMGIKDGKQVGIEFEFTSKKFSTHYFKKKFTPGKLYDHKIKDGKICVFRKDSPEIIEEEFDAAKYQIWNPEKLNQSPSSWVKDYSLSMGIPLVIMYKTRSDIVNYVVCWEKDFEFQDSIEIIELKNHPLIGEVS